ncbi:MAG: amidase [Dehalococcoidia bacterium]|nr:amidase [Dehalococcoidia bacterium]MDW8120104.1 amidase [Chloroflexota bacterium]
MPVQDITWIPGWRIRELIARRQISPVEVARHFLDRIDRLNPRLNAFLTVTYDLALAQAREAEEALLQGKPLGPLHGVPITVKDLFFTKGVRTTSGSLLYKDYIPQEDSVYVERVRKAGAVILGKTNTPEFGLLGSTENRLGEPCRNPWDPQRTAGGSSGGAGAAAAAGLGPLHIGSDGGGSIRIPCAFCGVFGLKPTQGRVPRYGGLGGWPLFSQVGPMTLDVRDSALLLQVLAGHDRRDPSSLRAPVPDYLADLEKGVRGLRMAWTPDYGYAPVEPAVRETCRRAALTFAELGAIVEEPPIALEEMLEVFITLARADTYATLGDLVWDDPAKRILLTPYAYEVFNTGRQITAKEYARALQARLRFIAALEDLFTKYDLLLSPTMPIVAFPLGQPPQTIAGRPVHPWLGFLPFTYPINLAGFAAASVPCGFVDGLPVGLHIIGKPLSEPLILRAARALEQARPWADKHPPLS